MSKRLIVTHIFPDLDAITAAWLLIRFDPEFSETGLEFVPAGSTYQGQAVDSDPTVVHVDTGMGRFDHHQTEVKTCAAELVFKDLLKRKLISEKHQSGLTRLVAQVIIQDNFEDFFSPEPANDRNDLSLAELINNLKISGRLNDKELVYQGLLLLDAALTGFMTKVKAEADIAGGRIFKTIWGNAIALESQNSSLSKLAQKMGYCVVIVKNPKDNFVSIKSQPRQEIDLTKIYRQLLQADPKATWFFHQSRHIITNGSRHNPLVTPSRLELEAIIEIVKNHKEVD